MVLSPASGKNAYRPDIDGLRAVAILAVLLFHYRIAGFSGGFAGVDVFFVISGFLITRLIHGEMRGGTFSILRFYEKRVRRIFPALIAMLAAATAVAAWLLFAGDFVRYARTLLATALFATNFELWRESGYFDAAARSKPLLHLWTIAVEEQFYLLFPLLLLALRRQSRAVTLGVIGTIAAASLGFSAWGVIHAPTASFYLLPARAWELGVGALLAIGGFAPSSTPLRHGAGVTGLAMIAGAVLLFDSTTRFPGLAALLPCLGAALVIYAGTGGTGWAGRLLSLRPMVFVGLISYSLYLWLWALLLVTRYQLFRAPIIPERWGLIAAAFALAALSWFFVEQPFRKGVGRAHRRPGGRTVLRLGAAATAMVAMTAGAVMAAGGLPQRMPPQIRRILAAEHDEDGLLQYCFALPLNKISAKGLCRFGVSRTVAPSFILWGDSHADAILLAVEDVAKHNGREGYFAGEPSCAPLMQVFRPDTPRCRDFNDHVLAFIKAHPEIDTVILMARWGKNAAGTATADEGRGFVPISDPQGRARRPADNAAIFARGLTRTVNALRAAHRNVVLVGPVPEIGAPVPQTLARLALAGDSRHIGPTLKKYLKREKGVLPLFHTMARRPGVSAVFPGHLLCASGRCIVSKDGIPLYRDSHHLSVHGALLLDPLLANIFEAEPQSG
jgi:peptidoglycan/LPS O-acetylase OafA/YrhL